MKRTFFLTAMVVSLYIVTFIEGKAQVSGEVSGVWAVENSPYLVIGDIDIPDSQTLIIEPGVEIFFSGHYRFDIHGQLLAIGTKENNITFRAQNSSTSWNGLRFNEISTSNDSSKIIYCKIQDGFPIGPTEDDKSGGGISVISVNKLLVAHCEITNNKTEGNAATGGAGIGIKNSSPIISQNFIANNVAEGGHGGGLAIANNSNPVIINNIIYNNTVMLANGEGGGGGGVVVTTSHPVLMNNTIINNQANHGGGFDFIFGSATVINSIVYGNSATHVGDQVHFGFDYTSSFLNCSIGGGKDAFAQDHTVGSPNFIGFYEYNIDANPKFLNDGEDFGLSEDSPCIGMGINTVEIDGNWYQAPSTDFYGLPRPRPESSNCDIGAIEHGELVSGLKELDFKKVPLTLQAFPNPFTSSTVLKYNLRNPAEITLRIVNLQGQEIDVLFPKFQQAGEQRIEWKAVGIKEGIYLAVLQSEKELASIKMIVQK
ncbi:MAG: T9SS type A sorting domain-containing protein [Bacteroidia bacterium]|nr:T9SS type A sorting domain-containing protein [Bacteroidia bacterium]